MPPAVDLLQRGRDSDFITNYLLQVLAGAPVVVTLAGVHYETLGIRALRCDEYGRLFVSSGTQDFHVINLTCTNVLQTVLTGAPIVRTALFTTQNNAADITFRMGDQRLEGPVTVQPGLPFTIAGRFTDVFAVNTIAGLVAILQAVVMFDNPQTG
jgi:hypothetical protein